jgi:PRTRC genetic system ThiF family protein
VIGSEYGKALPVVVGDYRHVEFLLVGCGGPGGFLAANIARLIPALNETGKRASATFIDPDSVESKNISRQNFVQAEIGLNKARVLALRYSLACGIELGAIASPFAAEMVKPEWGKLTAVIGAVDNAAARTEIAKTLDVNQHYQIPKLWWLDCGNHGNGIPAGQVLLGSTNTFSSQNAFNNPDASNFCINLPSPGLIAPRLLIPRLEELQSTRQSCAEIAKANQQSLFINQRVAAEAIEMLVQLTLTGGLKRFATYFHAGTGSSRSEYSSPDTLAKFYS